MTNLEKLKNKSLDRELLSRHPNNHLRRKYIRKLLTSELLYELLIEEKLSCLSISSILKNLGIATNAGNIIKLASEYGIKTLSLKESANSQNVRSKFRKTCLEKYGTENCLSKNTPSYSKRNNSVKLKYGVKNVFQLEEVKKKSKKTLNEKYGVNNPCELPYYRKNSGRRSKLQIKIEKYLKSINVDFEIEVGKIFSKHNPYFDKIYSPIVDILIGKKKIILEINGNVWHANPDIYKDNDLIKTWNGLLPAFQIRKRDLERKNQIESFGYKVFEIWEKDIRSNFEKVKEKINEILQIEIN